MIELKKIKKEYKIKKKKVQALDNVSLLLPNRGMISILGASGSGKSTLLNIIGGLDSYDSGEMFVDGESTKSFSEKEYAKYRNSYVGFIFQEFCLIEEYTVYENIALVEQLQKGKENQGHIKELLKKIGLEGYENRKIYELSGGQKQRVGIARILVKEPRIILADEPTGALDRKTGKEVMDLLKEISKEILVVFVTHNREYALEYGERIIELEDGKIIKDTKEQQEIEKEKIEYKSKEAKLPFKYAFKLGRKLLTHHKIRLSISILLMTLSSMFLIYAYFIFGYDVDEQHFAILKNKNIDTIVINKMQHGEKIVYNHFFPMHKDDKDYIQSKLNSPSYPLYEIDENPDVAPFFNINVYIQEDMFNDPKEEPTDLYTNNHMILKFVELEEVDKKLPIEEEVIGKYPIYNQEIMISNYVADLMIKYGIYEYKKDSVYYPKSYEELVNSSKLFQFGSYNSCKIVGIIDYDLRPYEELKKYIFGDWDHIPESIFEMYQELYNNQRQLYNKVYMSQAFIKNMKYPDNREIDSDHNVIELKMDDQNLIGIDYIREPVTYYDGKEWKKIDTLKDNEVLVNISAFYDNYSYALQSYVSKYPDRPIEEVKKEFFLQKLPTKKVIGEELRLEIYENTWDFGMYFKRKENYDKVYTNLKIIGIIDTTSSYSNLVSKNLLKEYQKEYFSLKRILVYESDSKKLKEIFHTFPYEGDYVINSIYSTESIYHVFLGVKDMIILLFLVFLLLSFALISNFMMSNVLDYKKNIGILRALGATRKDIFKIFLIQIIILVFILFFFNLIGMKIATIYLSYMYSTPEAFTFYYNMRILLLLLCYLIISITIVSILPILKITKLKPVEAIRNE